MVPRSRVTGHVSGYGVNQALTQIRSGLEYTSAYDGIGKGRLVGYRPFRGATGVSLEQAKLVALLNPLRDGRPARRCS